MSKTKIWVTYEDPAEVKANMEAYFQKCEDQRHCYGEADMALALKVSLKTLRGWKTGEAGEAWQEVAEWAYQKIAAQLETGYDYNHDKVMSRKAQKLMSEPWFQGYKTEPAKAETVLTIKFGKGSDATDYD